MPERFEERFGKDAYLHSVRRFLYQGKTRFQDVAILENMDGFRMLFLDRDLNSSEEDEKIYHECITHPVMLLNPRARSVLILGGGEGATLREVLRHGIERAVMVDIDKELVGLCKKHLPGFSSGAFEDQRAEVLFQDAGEFVKNCREKFDVVIMDLTFPGKSGLSERIFNPGFFQGLRKLLNPGFTGVVEYGDADPENSRGFRAATEMLGKAFGNAAPFAVYMPSFHCPNGFVLISDRKPEFDPETIQKTSEKLGLRFYDSESHARMFALPRYLRE